MSSFSVVILAAGIGKRMHSNLPKVLHNLCGRPLISYIIDTAKSLKPEKICLVIGKSGDKIKAIAGQGIEFIVQEIPKGTGDAVLKTEPVFSNFSGDILILPGDVPLISRKTLTKLLQTHAILNSALTVLTCEVQDPSLYGRIIRKQKEITKIIEDQDADERIKRIREINTGIYVFKKDSLFNALHRVKPLNKQKEYYLTDTIELIKKTGKKVCAEITKNPEEVIGINTRKTLSEVSRIIKMRIIEKWQLSGVNIPDPSSCEIGENVKIGRDTTIYHSTSILGNTEIGEGCSMGPSVTIIDSKIGNNVVIKPFTTIKGARLQ
jgi:bifunctional UDP-N-acetylglucosamine pyrophosphorylase/glucosamine-1-phosphate N-acetyltransferase